MHFYSLKPLNQSAQYSVFHPDLAINANPTFGFVFGLSIPSLKIRHRERVSGCQSFLPPPPFFLEYSLIIGASKMETLVGLEQMLL